MHGRPICRVVGTAIERPPGGREPQDRPSNQIKSNQIHPTAPHPTPPHPTPLHTTPLHSTPLHSTPLHSTVLNAQGWWPYPPPFADVHGPPCTGSREESSLPPPPRGARHLQATVQAIGFGVFPVVPMATAFGQGHSPTPSLLCWSCSVVKEPQLPSGAVGQCTEGATTAPARGSVAALEHACLSRISRTCRQMKPAEGGGGGLFPGTPPPGLSLGTKGWAH